MSRHYLAFPGRAQGIEVMKEIMVGIANDEASNDLFHVHFIAEPPHNRQRIERVCSEAGTPPTVLINHPITDGVTTDYSWWKASFVDDVQALRWLRFVATNRPFGQ